MNDTTKNILNIKDLYVHYTAYKSVIRAVNGVSFSLERGKSLGLVGETGAGKTTIAKSIMNILPDRQAHIPSGIIEFDGEDLLRYSEKKMEKVRGNKISMVFQDPMTALNPIEQVGDQIAETIRVHNKLSKAEAARQAIDILEMVGIPGDRYSEFPHQFSGGMKQRVVIAIAIACNPELLIADEPTTALDVTIQAQVLRMLNKLKNELKTSVIMITHDLGIVAEMCDEVAVVYAGEIVETGPVESIFDHASHPYTIGLFNSLPDLKSKEARLKPIKGLMPDPSNLPTGCKFHERCPYADEECRIKSPNTIELRSGHFVMCMKVKEEK